MDKRDSMESESAEIAVSCEGMISCLKKSIGKSHVGIVKILYELTSEFHHNVYVNIDNIFMG